MDEEEKGLERDQVLQDKTRSAKEYAEAVEAIAELAAVAVEFVPGLNKVKAVSRLASALPKAAKALKVAAPVLDNAVVADGIEKAKKNVPDAAKVALDRVVGAKDAALKPVLDKKAELEAAKARREARKSIIEAAEAMTVDDFETRFATYRSLVEGDGLGYLGQPGCYVFVLLNKGLKRDLTDYREVYVGASTRDMGVAISNELRGFGNPDVYADAKHKQNLYLLPFPCAADRVDALQASLIVALDANVSYNADRV